jgi:2,3-dihydroxyphenylpropionate 1,2-dioxygenase
MSQTVMLATSSHSPIIEFPAKKTDTYHNIIGELERVKADVAAFNPDLVVVFGVDHYGGHHMASMPPFCVGVEATALADVGGTPGNLTVPRDVAVNAVNFTRADGVDMTVSYAMDVDHGFTQSLVRLTGGIAEFPVLPIFVSCIQPPFVPFTRMRNMGESVGRYIRTLDYKRVLIIGTGGLSHNPRSLFPPIDEVSDKWRPYHLFGKAQSEAPQQTWIDYEIEAHKVAAAFLADDSIPPTTFGLHDDWDKKFMSAFCAGDMSVFDSWQPDPIVNDIGIGAMEVLSWVAAGAAFSQLSTERPSQRLQAICQEIGIGFGITSAGPTPVLA